MSSDRMQKAYTCKMAKVRTIHGSIRAFIDLHVNTAGRCQPTNPTQMGIKIDEKMKAQHTEINMTDSMQTSRIV